jgi:hypothetical protein
MNALISGIFPLMAASSGAYPETKGFALEEMQKKPMSSLRSKTSSEWDGYESLITSAARSPRSLPRHQIPSMRLRPSRI